MPSGPKKRKAAKRKKNKEKAQAKQTDVSEKLAKGSDLHEVENKIEGVSDNFNAIQENNDTTAVDYDVPVVMPGEAVHVEELAENEAANVVKEFDESKHVIGEVADMSMDVYVMERVILNNDGKEMSKDVTVMPQNSSCVIESVLSGASVVAPSNGSIKEAENTNMIHDQSVLVDEGMNDAARLVSKEIQALPTGTVPPTTENYVAEIPSDSKEIQALTTGTVPPTMYNQVAEIPSDSKGMQALPKGKVPPDTDNQVTDIPSDSKGMQALLKGTVPPDTDNQVTDIPSDSKEMQALPKGTVPPAMENQVTELPSDLKEMQALLKGTVPPVTDNQVYFACPVHCKAECSFSQLLRGQLMEKVVQIKNAIRSLKEDLDRLDSISY